VSQPKYSPSNAVHGTFQAEPHSLLQLMATMSHCKVLSTLPIPVYSFRKANYAMLLQALVVAHQRMDLSNDLVSRSIAVHTGWHFLRELLAIKLNPKVLPLSGTRRLTEFPVFRNILTSSMLFFQKQEHRRIAYNETYLHDCK
jgi:hypothetical protein